MSTVPSSAPNAVNVMRTPTGPQARRLDSASAQHGAHGASAQHVYRDMPPYGQAVASYHSGSGDLFRGHHPAGLDWNTSAALGGQDPRLTPSGDVARRGTIPSYVPFAPVNPRRIVNLPQ